MDTFNYLIIALVICLIALGILLHRIRKTGKKEKKLMPIELTMYEKAWIKFSKGHFKDMLRTDASSWVESAKPLFKQIYGWDPDEGNNMKDFRSCLFNKLYSIHYKIAEGAWSRERVTLDVFKQAFSHTERRDYDLPIERAIAELLGEIKCNTVIEDGFHRYNLDLTDEEMSKLIPVN